MGIGAGVVAGVPGAVHRRAVAVCRLPDVARFAQLVLRDNVRAVLSAAGFLYREESVLPARSSRDVLERSCRRCRNLFHRDEGVARLGRLDAPHPTMKPLRPFLIFAFCLLIFDFSLSAHVGSPDIYLEGKGGPYEMTVVVRPPSIVPGVAVVEVYLRDKLA